MIVLMVSARFAALALLALTSLACEAVEGRLDRAETAAEERLDPAAVASSPPGVGDPAPEFALRDSEGRTVRLADALGQRVVLVFYRAHW